MYKIRNPQIFVVHSSQLQFKTSLLLDAPWDSFNQGTLQEKLDVEYEKLLSYLARMKRLKRKLTVQEASEIRIIFELLLDTNQALY